jgi:hypothetical protein
MAHKNKFILYLFYIIIGLVIIYKVSMFLYLKIAGVYGIAIITESATSSDGVRVMYEFNYKQEKYSGGLTADLSYEIGDKYFVSFSESNPEYNMLQYNHPVPDCLKDSLNSFWEAYPTCTKNP